MKRWVVIAGLVVFVLGVAMVSIDSAPLGTLLLEEVARGPRSRGVLVSGDEARVSLTRFTVKRLGITFLKALSGVVIDEAEIRPRHLSLFSLSPSFHVNAALYRGKLDADARVSSAGEPMEVSLEGSGIQLGDHPQLAGFGITSGTLELGKSSAVFKDGVPIEAVFDLKIRELTKQGETVVPARQLGLPFDLVVPAFTGGELDLAGTMKGQSVDMKGLRLSSSLAKVDGEFNCQVLSAGGQCVSGRGRFTVRLEPQLQRMVAQWLPVFSGGSVKDTDNAFEISFSGDLRRTVPVIKPVR